jgi:hypothetical protein
MNTRPLHENCLISKAETFHRRYRRLFDDKLSVDVDFDRLEGAGQESAFLIDRFPGFILQIIFVTKTLKNESFIRSV